METRRGLGVEVVGFCAVLLGCAVAVAGPDHPLVTEVLNNPVGAKDGPLGRDPASLHQEFIELYIPPLNDLRLDLLPFKDALNLAVYEVEGDQTSSGYTLVNYRIDLPTFDLDSSNGITALERPFNGIVVIGWIDYLNPDAGTCAVSGLPCSVFAQDCADLSSCDANAPAGLAGTPTTRVAMVNGGVTTTGNYLFVAMNGTPADTTNFAVPVAVSHLKIPNEAASGIVQNGSSAYLLVNRDALGYVELYDDKDPDPTHTANDPRLDENAALMVTSFLSGFAGNDDSLFVVSQQPYQFGDPIDLADVLSKPSLPAHPSPYADLVPQIAEGTGNGYMRLFLDVPTTSEDGIVGNEDPALDAETAFRTVSVLGPWFPTPGRATFTTSPPELAVAQGSLQVLDLLAGTTRRQELLVANVGGNFAIQVTVVPGASDNPLAATFSTGDPVIIPTGQTAGFPTIDTTVSVDAPDNITVTAPVNVEAVNVNPGDPTVVNPTSPTSAAVHVLDPTTGKDVNGLPFETTVFMAIQAVPDQVAVNNEFLTTDVGAFLAAQPDILLFETLGHGVALMDPLTNLRDKTVVRPWVKDIPQVGEECVSWLPRLGVPLAPGLPETVAMSAEASVLGSVTYTDPAEPSLLVCSFTGELKVKGIRVNIPETFTFGGVFSPSETVHFVNANGGVGNLDSSFTNVTTDRTFEIVLLDTNVNNNAGGTIETGSSDDFGIVVQVLATEPDSPFATDDYVFLSYAGGLEGADVDTLNVPPGNNMMDLIFLDLDNLHTVLGIRSIKSLFVIDAGGGSDIDIIEAFSLHPITGPGCVGDPDCDDGVFCNGTERCVGGVCQLSGPVDCNDGVACTTDVCNEAANSCDHAPVNAACDNGQFCDGVERCDVLLGCRPGTPVNCGDAIPCTVDSCDESADTCQHLPDDALCGNGQFCDGVETCDAALGCQSGSDPCPDPSTLCDESADQCVGCLANVDCDDGLFCNGTETCASGVCQGGAPVNCDDGILCTVDTCDESTTSCVHTPSNALCDNGQFCDGVETCALAVGCVAGTRVDCADAVACTIDLCNESTNNCDHIPDDAACDNGQFCDGNEICSASAGCLPGTDPCPDPDTVCDDVVDACVGCVNNADCDDGIFCDGAETCVSGSCQDGAPPCDDLIACTVDSCNESLNTCQNVPNSGLCDDGFFCNGAETCSAAVGCQPGTAPNCADTIGCTIDTCNEATDRCDHSPDNAACSDGLFCTGIETCNIDLGCLPGFDPCPGTICDEPAGTCRSCLNSGECDDGLFCTGTEICVAGICFSGSSVNCNDGVPCSADFCDEDIDACRHLPNDPVCDDGQFCTGVEVCDLALGCQSAGNPCLIPTDCDEAADSCGCVPSSMPQAETIRTLVSTKNRFLSFTAGDPGQTQAIIVTIVAAPAPFDIWNGLQLWVGAPSEVNENGSSVPPVAGFPSFQAATLQCDGPVYLDWASLGTVHVFHEAIIPLAVYQIQVIDVNCTDLANPANYSDPLDLVTSAWGDTVTSLAGVPPDPPDGSVAIIDVLAILGRFVSDPASIMKSRADLEPNCLDLVINVSDVLFALTGFQGLPYPFAPSGASPCDSPCPNPLP